MQKMTTDQELIQLDSDFRTTCTSASAKLDLAYEFLEKCFFDQQEASMSAAAGDGLLCVIGEAKDALEKLEKQWIESNRGRINS